MKLILIIDNTEIHLGIPIEIVEGNFETSVFIFEIGFSFNVEESIVLLTSLICGKILILFRNEHICYLVCVVSVFPVGVDGEGDIGEISVLM